MDDPIRVVLVTAPTEASPGLARQLVDERLVACANLLPGATSIYRWEGAVEEAGETVMLMKTGADRVAALRDRLVELHPYDVPEFLVLGVDEGLPEYLSWVVDSTTPGEGP